MTLELRTSIENLAKVCLDEVPGKTALQQFEKALVAESLNRGETQLKAAEIMGVSRWALSRFLKTEKVAA